MAAVTKSTARDPKWDQPGWRLESHYAPSVMVGNWAEERLKFNRHLRPNSKSVYDTDYRGYSKLSGANVTNRRRALIREDGLPSEQLIKHHHGYSNHMITWYDEQFNGRKRPFCQIFPEQREYSSHKLAWVPEKSDYPLEGPPTNFGLLPKLQRKWQTQLLDDRRGEYNSTYRLAYAPCHADFYTDLRMATPKAYSSSLNPVNRILKNVAFRGDPRSQTREFFAPPPGPTAMRYESFDKRDEQ